MSFTRRRILSAAGAAFALPVLVGYAPELMSKPVWGPVNIAYLFALSQFFMAWILAWRYVRAAGRFDAMAKRIVERSAVSSDKERAE